MEPESDAQISKFLLGFSEEPELQPLIFGLFLSMYLIFVLGKPTHHPGCQLIPPPPHPYVLLPLQPVISRHLFHLNHHPKDAVEHPDTDQRYNV